MTSPTAGLDLRSPYMHAHPPATLRHHDLALGGGHGLARGWLGTGRPWEPSSTFAADYVCVMDVDLLELVIKTWKGSTEGKLVSGHLWARDPGVEGVSQVSQVPLPPLLGGKSATC